MTLRTAPFFKSFHPLVILEIVRATPNELVDFINSVIKVIDVSYGRKLPLN